MELILINADANAEMRTHLHLSYKFRLINS